MPSDARRRYALVGTGARAEMFAARPRHRPRRTRAELVALADVNPARMAAHNRWLAELGAAPVPTYPADRVRARCSPRSGSTRCWSPAWTATHDEYIVAALRRRLRRDHREADDHRRAELPADPRRRRAQTGRQVTVAFNYRYNPVHERVRELLAGGEIGEIGSVHFEWLLDVRHGADYFRRWHRDKANSGGLLVHKAEPPLRPGQLVARRGAGRGLRVRAAVLLRRGRRAGTATPATTTGRTATRGRADDPFALHLADNPRLRALYLDAEARGRLPPRPERLRARRDHRGRHGGAGPLRHRRHDDLPPHRVLAVGGLPGRCSTAAGAGWSSRWWRATTSAPASPATVKGAALHGVEAAAEQGSVRADRAAVLGAAARGAAARRTARRPRRRGRPDDRRAASARDAGPAGPLGHRPRRRARAAHRPGRQPLDRDRRGRVRVADLLDPTAPTGSDRVRPAVPGRARAAGDRPRAVRARPRTCR